MSRRGWWLPCWLVWSSAAITGVACNPGFDPGSGSPVRAVQPIFYGQTTPTLYTGLTASEQNAVVQLYAPMYGQGFCSGSLISEHVVLTAGHCIHPPDQGEFTASDITIRIGPDSSDPIAELSVQRVAHKDWESSYQDDVGIAILSSAYSAVPHLTIKRSGTAAISGNQAQAVGFGMTQDDDPNYPTNSLRYWTTLAVEWVDSAGIVVNGGGSSGVAPGDSGSPLLYDFGAGPQVAGIASTSEEGWVYSANYTNVETQESYIQQFIDQYDNPACVSQCNGVACGQVGSCMCGVCERGFQCQSNQCQEIPAGSGGVCVTLQSVATVCNAANPCPNNQICLPYDDGSSECGERCGPERCASNDASSYCLAFATYPSGYINLCIETSPATCSTENGSCTTSAGASGYCLNLDGSGALRCYATCSTVVTCPTGTGCLPYTPPDCSATCIGRQCGTYQQCNCGQCTAPQRCESNQCVDDCAPDCANRECGDDLCGSVCGDCATGYRCNDDGQCQAASTADAGTGNDQHTATLCGCGQASAANGSLASLALALLAMRRRTFA